MVALAHIEWFRVFVVRVLLRVIVKAVEVVHEHTLTAALFPAAHLAIRQMPQIVERIHIAANAHALWLVALIDELRQI